MKKAITGVAIVASLFLMSGCGESVADKKHNQSISSSKKAARISSKKAASESKAVKSDIADATTATKKLFANSDALDYEEPDYSKLYDGTTLEDVETVEKQVDMLPNSKTRTNLQKLISKAMALAKQDEPSVDVTQSKADESSLAKYRSESIDRELSSTKSSSSTKTTAHSTSTHYDKVDLETFATETDKYIGKNIVTSGEVAYIQKNPDNTDIYYVVILPKDDHASSGYSYGTVTEINVDTFDETNINEGDNITVKGGALTSTIKLNGKTLKSDIVVDSVSVN